ncbi:MBL fold metallo-hydrolase [Tsukamurella ocularis]|uniref:MBL fold metallo-hydrolase n=1 Tax=Tsukamurella ocularis TaxID=1970234 RepID=UPI002167995F|nr:MBL fold metallo-hydrolase [Tsukamurella ocularis]MCS3779000.1 glyoxylase-like metal-dependent hydrolase (beta-lactamase superfamily II) [Tsukamurella ocularis]MCS3787380.1 glyoxylase-like metal-dependent hydrolase (beta-lactamase superfamily II) [Tsukamurella ocularis]MCS3851683.1 glyoxylase-like metal-dependent hydrolase (beta-lactamase superfamily II) [Tsukamurella ocularis]
MTEHPADSHPGHPLPGKLRQVTPYAAVLLCDNPSVMTLEGTNTWILRAPGREEAVVVDPGPKGDKKHLKRVAKAAGTVALTLVTHRHADHTGGLKRWEELTRSPIRAFSPTYCINTATPLTGGEVIEVAGLRITVLHTPGHTADSLSFLVDGAGGEPGALVSGDTILGRGTTVLDASDGTLADYLGSLKTLSTVAAGRVLLPGHGPDLPDAAPVVAAYAAHRQDRLQQVRDGLTAMGVSAADAKPMKVVKHVYRDVDKKAWPAAKMSVKVQLQYLAEHG